MINLICLIKKIFLRLTIIILCIKITLMNKFIDSTIAIPRRITPCPIVDAVVEIRFATDMLSDAIFGIIYQTVIADFPRVEKLPVTQIPEQIRDADPSLKHQPHYRFQRENLVFQAGPNIMSLNCVGEYIGWDAFLTQIVSLFNKIHKIGFVKQVERLGLRYINFFEHDVLNSINMQLYLNSEPFRGNNTLIRTEIQNGNMTSILNIASSVQTVFNGAVRNGSVVDIDVTRQICGENFFADLEGFLTTSHNEEKKIFFTLLKNDFLSSLSPEY